MANNITKAAAVIVVMNFVAKLLGFVREMAIAGAFGATMYTDAYLVAYTLPYSLQAVLGSALVTVTVPLLTKYLLEENKKEAFLVGNYFLNLVALVMLIVTILGIAFAPILVKITAPLFDGETAALAVQLTRIMFPAILFMSIGMVLSGYLNANHRFLVSASAPALCSAIIIISVCLVSRIQGLAIGTLLGFVGFMLIHLPSVAQTGFRYQAKLSWHHPDVRAAMVSLVPIVLGTSVNQIYYIINRIFASGLAEGSISALNYASKVVNLPGGIFVAAMAVAIYPYLTEYAMKGEEERLDRVIHKGVGLVMFLGIPSAVGLMVLRQPIITLLFQRGAFDATATAMTSSALLWYAIGLLPFAVVLVMVKVFYAFEDNKLPLYAGGAGILVNLAISFLTMKWMGVGGLALATSLAGTANMLVFFIALKKHMPHFHYGPLVQSFGKIFF
ncbi:MAG: murein biosynthesis integral membrane protein MurJ, partial [Bacillota bacterium]|nr:murein biosynthesis integral membrane protein MurJ [Bacillota bacterium]